jgi:malonyl-CoA/methylmalonyl-CoA synthetase
VLGLCAAWHWSHTDSLLHTLPLHHIHGIVNALYCPLYIGARVDMHTAFNPQAVWSHLMVSRGVS